MERTTPKIFLKPSVCHVQWWGLLTQLYLWERTDLLEVSILGFDQGFKPGVLHRKLHSWRQPRHAARLHLCVAFGWSQRTGKASPHLPTGGCVDIPRGHKQQSCFMWLPLQHTLRQSSRNPEFMHLSRWGGKPSKEMCLAAPARELQHSRQHRQFERWVSDSTASREPYHQGFACCTYTSQPWVAASCLAEVAGRLFPPSSTPFLLPLLKPTRHSSCCFLSRLNKKMQLDDIYLPSAKLQTEVYTFKEI